MTTKSSYKSAQRQARINARQARREEAIEVLSHSLQTIELLLDAGQITSEEARLERIKINARAERAGGW